MTIPPPLPPANPSLWKPKVRRSFRVLCRSSLAIATSMVNAVKAGTPPQDILPETSEAGYPGAGTFGGSSRHGSANSMSSARRKRGGGGGAEGLQYPALVDRAVATLTKVRVTAMWIKLVFNK